MDTFDQETGQVYLEWIVSAPPRRELGSVDRPSGQIPGPVCQDVGAPSLVALCLRELLPHLDALTVDVLENVPMIIGKMLWEQIQRHDLVTFQLWSMFVARYPNHHELGLQPYRRKLPNPTMSLADYVRPVTALKMEWITLLSIGMTAVPTAEYASLAAIPNLGGLDLLSHNEYQTRAPVHDGLVRAWSRAAKHDACFSALRVLSLRRWPDVTARTLGYLGVFPALRYFVLQARSDPSGLILRPVPLKGWSGELRLTRPETMPELFRKAVRDADASGHSAGPVAQLELELGRPYHDLLPYRHDLVSPCGPSLTGRTSRPYPVIYRRDDLQHQQRAEGESSTNDPMGAVAPGTTAPGATPTFVVRASKRRALQEVLAELDDRVQRRQPSPGEKRLKI